MFNAELELCLSRGLTWPNYTVNLDQLTLQQQTKDVQIVIHRGSVTDALVLRYLDKDQQETIVHDGIIVQDQRIEVLTIRVDGIKIPKHMIEKLGQYMPSYRSDFIEYCKKQNITVDSGPMCTTSFYHAGTWSMFMPVDFWAQYHSARQLNLGNDFSGNNREEIQTSLKRIRSLL